MNELSGQQRGQAPPQYSRDGRWWWDGHQWTPAQWAPARGPGRRLYLVAAAALVLGVVLVGLAVLSIAGPVGSEIKLVAPGSAEITLAKPGTYMINYEYQAVRNGRQFNTPVEFPPMTMTLLSRPSGAQIPIRGYPGESNYAVGNTGGKAIARFKIDRPGTYVFTTQYAQGKEGPQVALAIGEDTTVTTILGVFAMVLGIWSLIGGLTTALIVFILRYRAPVDPVRARVQKLCQSGSRR